MVTSERHLPSYSIAIRTLGKSGIYFERELQSILKQTVQPEKILIYIAKGFKHPSYSIGQEVFIEVPKGMVSQRALDFNEITSEYIFLLDDDVELAPDSVEKILSNIIEYNADCISAETVHNHTLSPLMKFYNILVNFTFPFYSKRWGMKVSCNGAMSFNNKPENRFYESQTGEGAALMVKKSAWLSCDIKSEKWMDDLGFAYADDLLEIYKIHSNGFKCGILYDSGVKHLDGATSSGKYKSSPLRFRYRSRAIFLNWHRMFLCSDKLSGIKKFKAILAFVIRSIVIQPSYILAGISNRNYKIPFYHVLGIIDGIKFAKSLKYRILPKFN